MERKLLERMIDEIDFSIGHVNTRARRELLAVRRAAAQELSKAVFEDMHEVRQCILIGGMVADALCDVMGKLFEVLGKEDGFDDETMYLRNRAAVVEHWCVTTTEVPR